MKESFCKFPYCFVECCCWVCLIIWHKHGLVPEVFPWSFFIAMRFKYTKKLSSFNHYYKVHNLTNSLSAFYNIWYLLKISKIVLCIMVFNVKHTEQTASIWPVNCFEQFNVYLFIAICVCVHKRYYLNFIVIFIL